MSERRESLLREIRRACAGDADVDLAEAALLLAALDLPDADLDEYRRYLRALAAEVAAATPAGRPLGDGLAALRDVVYGRHGFKGDAETYEDMQNANLIRVIDRRKGLPVALGILLMHAARGRRWTIAGLAFPSHFLLRLGGSDEQLIVDPFDGARAMSTEDLSRRARELLGPAAELRPEYLAPVGDRDVLLRLQNNIKLRALASGQTERAIDVLESMAAVAPDRGGLRLELAELHARLGAVKAAIRVLDDFLALGAAADRGEIQRLRSELKSRLN